MCTFEEYWPRIGRIPLYPDFDSDDGDAVICKNYNGQIFVRVTKPECLASDEKREAAIAFYEMFYRPQFH